MLKNKNVKKARSLRKKAERILGRSEKNASALSAEEIQKQCHELAIHQIELEMQNEDLKETQSDLMAARDRYLELYDFAPVGYATIDTHNVFLEANLAICRMLGVDRRDLIGRRLTEYVDPSSQETYYYWLRRSRQAAAKADQGIKMGCEARMMRQDGSAFYARLEAVFKDSKVRLAIVDVTDLKDAQDSLARAAQELEEKVRKRTAELAEANARLTEYGRRITQVQEEERKRIAYELHDDTAQYLSILKLQLDSLLDSGKVKDSVVQRKLRELAKDANRAFNEVRRYSHELRPGTLEHLGLRSAVEQMAEDMNQLNHIAVELNVSGSEPPLTEDVRLALFRIAQEALGNARRHSQATVARVGLQYTPDRVRLIVSDNGVGFDLESNLNHAPGRRGLGLMRMQERAELIGADFQLESIPGKGTRVVVDAQVEG